MRRTWYQLLGMDRFYDADGSVDRPCYGIFPARDTAEEVAEYFATVGTDTEIVEVEADWAVASGRVIVARFAGSEAAVLRLMLEEHREELRGRWGVETVEGLAHLLAMHGADAASALWE